MWDIGREPGALLQPGYRVRFYDMEKRRAPRQTNLRAVSSAHNRSAETDPHFKVLAAPLPATFQDAGRFGQTGQGVSTSGALDQSAYNAANRVVGNPAGMACLELTLGGFSFQSSARAVIAVTGAPCPVAVSAGAETMTQACYQPISLEPGDIVTFGAPPRGMRSYLSVRGGFLVEPVLRSAATDTLAVVGPDQVKVGAILRLANNKSGLSSVSLTELPAFQCPRVSEVVTLDVVLGPRTDWFTDKGIETLTNQVWEVTPQSNRIGIRLFGETPIERRDSAELPSEGTANGAIQIPHSGQPVLFLADHPLTGGYPVIAAVAEYHLDLAGQLPINAKIRFRPIAPFAEITADATA
jgi:biotin-dependent carboxylase-like uncharacterized protein